MSHVLAQVKRLMDTVAEDPEEGEQFVREATIWGQLRHPCIVQFLGITLFDEYQSPLGVVQVCSRPHAEHVCRGARLAFNAPTRACAGVRERRVAV